MLTPLCNVKSTQGRPPRLRPESYLSVWLHNKPAFNDRGEESAASANRVQSRRHTVSGEHMRRLGRYPQLPFHYLRSLRRTPRAYRSFRLPDCFLIYVAFLKPLTPRGLRWPWWTSLCVRSHKTPTVHTCVPPHANTPIVETDWIFLHSE